MAYEVPIPSWLQSPAQQVGPLYAQGFASGAHVAAQQRAAEDAMAENQREFQIKQATLEQAMLRAQQELLIKKEYQDSSVLLRQRGIDIARDRQQLAADLAARKYAAQQDVGRRLQQGQSFEQALFANPDLMTSGVTEALVRGRQTEKEYGTPITEDIPGLPGGKMIYRKGSPGVHIALPPRTGLTAPQQVKVQNTIDQLRRSRTEMTSDDPLQAGIDASIKRYEALLNPPQAPSAAPVANPGVPVAAPEVPVVPPGVPVANPIQPSGRAGFNPQVDQYMNGTVLRKKDGSRWIVQNGHIVRYDQPELQAEPEPEQDNITNPNEELIPAGGE